MSPYTKALTSTSLILGTIITTTSNHWIMAWIGLETNTLAIIPLISKTHHPRAIEAAIKCFLVQATASTLLLFSSTINAWSSGQWDITLTTHPTPCLLMTTAMAMKLGLAPFHFWYPEVLQGTSITTALLLSTLMKLPPLTLLIMTSHSLNPTMLTLLAISSAALGGWMGLNQTQTRKILAFSSISHLGWMIIIILYQPKLTTLTFYLYVMMTAAVFLTLNTTKALNLPTLMTSWTKTPILNTTFTLTLLSLAGLPPLTGFFPKWLIIQELTKQELTPTAVLITMLSLLSLFFYLRLMYHSAITIPPNTSTHMKHWHTHNSANTLTAALTSSSIMLLPLSPMIMALV
uniref:NADH-ubiquinone oxidoreductase chain 2 n=1 Tax=Glaucidium cuculoides TaxID=543873 RepID=B4YM12_9STRI|nr:NADH dehydrogenase subunit 2 [Glaucidium cuculoides]ACF08165.1 NADH dehydrogenase subunit 2 [Glaucidium cuculoides]AQY15763.1 NADH dehydrogenase subunit 2 [Glaucidium cuculoides]